MLTPRIFDPTVSFLRSSAAFRLSPTWTSWTAGLSAGYLDQLDRTSLRRILTEPKNAIIRQYEKLFEMDGMKLEIEPEVLDLIVDTSIERKLGARGLRSICEELMNDAMFEAPSSKKKTFKLTLAYAKERLAD